MYFINFEKCIFFISLFNINAPLVQEMEEKRKSGKKRKKTDIDDAEESMGIVNRLSGKKKQQGKPMKKKNRR